MGTPFVGEIRLFAGNFPPQDWYFCDGSALPISQYDTLFNLIGTTYGGDGVSTFNLPDLRGRLPVHQGTDLSGTPWTIGQSAGTETVTLTVNQLPAHRHPYTGGGTASLDTPSGNTVAGSAANFAPGVGTQALDATAMATVGNILPHDNRMPYLALSFIISVYGIYPSRS